MVHMGCGAWVGHAQCCTVRSQVLALGDGSCVGKREKGMAGHSPWPREQVPS